MSIEALDMAIESWEILNPYAKYARDKHIMEKSTEKAMKEVKWTADCVWREEEGRKESGKDSKDDYVNEAEKEEKYQTGWPWREQCSAGREGRCVNSGG